jgi:HSP20 family protein
MTRSSEWWPIRWLAEWPDWPSRVFDWPNLAALREGERILRIEEFQEGDTLVIRSEMPGIDPDKDVAIDVRDHTLEIRAERKEETTTEERGVRHSEFRYGDFFRAVPLPTEATERDVKASYKDGILEVRVPCAPAVEAAPHKIPVTRG